MNKSTQDTIKKGLCAPTVLSLILGAASVISAGNPEARKQMLVASIVQALILWTLCYYGYIKAAWAVLLLPVLLVIGAFLLGFVAIASGKVSKSLLGCGMRK